ncbi:hypothetical protein AC239_03250 [Bacteroides fragilis]|nr:hypothetical protein AC239_03250 [Bacteroides fragilis]
MSIPDMTKDFMTFDSGDITNVNSLSHNLLPVSFSQKLCKLTITISPTGFPSNTITNCTGVYVKQGGNSTSWKIGPSTNVVAANTNNTAAFSPNTTLSTTIRMVPFAGARTITVHFNTLTISGRTVPNNTEITSTQSVQLKEGKSYTMKIQFKKAIGINVPASNINLTQNGCIENDKTILSKLRWAEGNLNSQSNYNLTWASSTTDYGYYYIWKNVYVSSGYTGYGAVDPCTRLDESKYGSGWRTPTRSEFISLSRCSNKQLVKYNGIQGMWFMNSSTGLFLPAAGWRDGNNGSGTTATAYTDGTGSYYWSSDLNGNSAYGLYILKNDVFVDANGNRKSGVSVRCVHNL